MPKDIINSTEYLFNKVHNLESNIAFQEEAIEALNKTVGIQHQEIQLLKEQLIALSEYIKAIRENSSQSIKPAHEETPPPHY